MDTASSAFHDAKVAHVTGHGGSSAADVFGVVIGTAVWAIMAHRGCTLSSTSPTIFTTLKTRYKNKRRQREREIEAQAFLAHIYLR